MADKTQLEAAAALMKDPTQREALAELIIEYANPMHITSDWIGMLLNTRSLNPGDALVRKVRKGIKVHTHVPGAIPLKSEITVSERINYVLDTAQVSVGAGEMELASGELGTVAEISSEMQAKLRDYLVNKVFTSLTTVWTAANTPNNFTSVGGSLTSTALDNAIQRINQTTSGAKAIVGTRAALQPITSFAQWDSTGGTTALIQGIAEELRRTGWLGSYAGVPIVVVNQDYDNIEDYNALIPTDKVLVLGENVGDFITYGGVNTQQYTDMRPVPPYWNLTLWTQFGMIIDRADGLYVIGGLS